MTGSAERIMLLAGFAREIKKPELKGRYTVCDYNTVFPFKSLVNHCFREVDSKEDRVRLRMKRIKRGFKQH
jgi:hypothetical protein